ncbi:MAG: UDP-N-acetylmuramoyl-L-alanyl-D-glutamate--2,6-diaminopimelate ligase [Oscillospiraceae bacterium]|nr:UDP-N-acetylmuramoyl-L-alanyl-D-glutamate--2,6-diaminopimelate ligase [Oscillospiraceae bacterium]
MKLSQLLSNLGADCPQDADITALTCDSREVVPGALFVALEGANADGRAYIPDALERGAAALVCRRSLSEGPLPEGVPGVALDDPRAALALLAAEFYGHPAQQLTLIAVTGTKGKTTTAHMLRDILTAAGHKTGMIGTLGAYIDRELLSATPNTTPEPITLHRTLRQMADAGCTHVVMEVSSQAMKLKRVAGITFAAALFLNLSPDHIGGAEHADFDEYRACKAALFRQCRLAVGNVDDPNWPAMAAQLPTVTPVITFGFGADADVRGLSTAPDSDRPLCTRLTVEGTGSYAIPLPGRFNAADALAAIALCRALGVSDKAVRAGLAHTSVPGRAQRYPAPAPYSVVIDYAHNGTSFDAILSALTEHHPRRIILVFGAGGDRPKMRRRDMALSASGLADYAVLTEDNPRSEPVADICADISAALEDFPHETVLDRRAAIYRALDLAGPGDVVALLGKGHEQYIEKNGVRRPFSEWAVLDEYFNVQR